MNTTKLMAALAVACSIGSSFAANTTNITWISGSTAFRTYAANALDANYSGGLNGGWQRVAYTSDGTVGDSGNQKSTARLYKKVTGTSPNQNVQFINVRWLGSEGGLQACAAPAGQKKIGFLPLDANGGTYTTTDLTLSNNVTIAFSDVKQDVSRFLKTGAKGLNDTTAYTKLDAPTPLGVLDFVWAGSSNFPTSSVNMTKDIAVELFNNGSCPLSRFTGDSNDVSKTVYLAGRNVDSGTRCAALLNAGLFNTATIKQYAISGVDATPTLYADETVNGLVCTGGMGGYNKGGDVATALGNLQTSTNNFAVGYVGRSDYSSSKNVLLKWQGTSDSVANITTGNYPFWTVENLYKAKTVPAVSKPLNDSVYQNLVDTIVGLADIAPNATLSSMKVQRAIDGGVISSK